jgi:hypothetical protein
VVNNSSALVSSGTIYTKLVLALHSEEEATTLVGLFESRSPDHLGTALLSSTIEN